MLRPVRRVASDEYLQDDEWIRIRPPSYVVRPYLGVVVYWIVLLATLDIALCSPLLVYAVTPKYQVPDVRLVSV